MDVTKITDQVFSSLDETVLPELLTLFSSDKFLAEKKRLEREETNPHKRDELRTILQNKQNEQVGELSSALLKSALPKIFPEAALWFKGDTRPDNEWLWVVSPFEFALMAPATVSVALQQADELLLGVWCNLSDFEITTGELGGGSWQGENELLIRNNELTNTCRSMQFTSRKPDGIRRRCSSDAYYSLNKHYELTPMINQLDEQIANHVVYVASGMLDFTLGLDFSYHDIAAAICIVEQTGGIVTDFSGSKEKLFTGEEFFASNKIIHRQFMEVAKGL